MDIWAHDVGLSPAPRHPHHDPRRVAIAAIVAVILLVGLITVIVNDGERPVPVAAATI